MSEPGREHRHSRGYIKLSPREEEFVAAYVAHGNATKAAESAGYAPGAARVTGHRLVNRPRVAMAIRIAQNAIASKYKVTAEKVVEGMAIIAFADIRHYAFTVDGGITLSPGAPDVAIRAVRRVKRKPVSLKGPNGEGVIAYETEFELWNKDSALRNLGEYLKLFKENRIDDADEDQLTDDELRERVVTILKAALQRKREAQRAAITAGAERQIQKQPVRGESSEADALTKRNPQTATRVVDAAAATKRHRA